RDRIHAVGRQEEPGPRMEVRGRKAERAPAPIADDDAAAERVGTAEQATGLSHVATLHHFAHERAADVLPVRLDRTDYVDAESQPRAERAERVDRPGAIAAEPHVVADDHVHELQVTADEVVDELLGREPGEGPREPLHDAD